MLCRDVHLYQCVSNRLHGSWELGAEPHGPMHRFGVSIAAGAIQGYDLCNAWNRLLRFGDNKFALLPLAGVVARICARQAKLISALAGQSKSAVQAAQAGLAKHSPQSGQSKLKRSKQNTAGAGKQPLCRHAGYEVAVELRRRAVCRCLLSDVASGPIRWKRSTRLPCPPRLAPLGSQHGIHWSPGGPFGRTCAGHGGCMPSSHLQALETGARRSRMETACTSSHRPTAPLHRYRSHTAGARRCSSQ
ncbi:hypothetical protein HaLaN_21911 [Haematococcus lacustris]|uniref:Uncharacterized protein n=1 Tax=Haematococcus lacustris TaxID=44745 RepID=A0A699ZSM3_HAELA|nr:hypothetical protein HaLaN_21911 [Haematococcus lacustris]